MLAAQHFPKTVVRAPTSAEDEYKAFVGADVVSVNAFTRDKLSVVFELAGRCCEIVATQGSVDWAKGRLLSAIFFEASTRTSTSFQAAMLRLGGSAIAIDVGNSSVTKGESLEDTARCLESYSDAIVMRHFQVLPVVCWATYIVVGLAASIMYTFS